MVSAKRKNHLLRGSRAIITTKELPPPPPPPRLHRSPVLLSTPPRETIGTTGTKHTLPSFSQVPPPPTRRPYNGTTTSQAKNHQEGVTAPPKIESSKSATADKNGTRFLTQGKRVVKPPGIRQGSWNGDSPLDSAFAVKSPAPKYQHISSNSSVSASSDKELQVKITFLSLTGIISRKEGAGRKQPNLTETRAVVALSPEAAADSTSEYKPSRPLQSKTNENERQYAAEWEAIENSHATLNFQATSSSTMKIISLCISLTSNGNVIPFGVATLDWAVNKSLPCQIEKKLPVQSPTRFFQNWQMEHTEKKNLASCLTIGKDCFLRVRIHMSNNNNVLPKIKVLQSTRTKEITRMKISSTERNCGASHSALAKAAFPSIPQQHRMKRNEGNYFGLNSKWTDSIGKMKDPLKSDVSSMTTEIKNTAPKGENIIEQKNGMERLMETFEKFGFFQNCTTPASSILDDGSVEEQHTLTHDNRSHSASSQDCPLHPDEMDSVSTQEDKAGHFQGDAGTLLLDRYLITRNLGFGTFGKVVACTDMQGQYKRELAIKIIRDDQNMIESAHIEATILQQVNANSDSRGTALCVEMFGHFLYLEGRHFCLVFESLGWSLYDFMKHHKFQPFPLYCIRDFSYQLLNALDFLHSTLHLIHTDLKPENILLLSNDVEKRTDVSSGWCIGSFYVPTSTRIKLIDFGGATFDNEQKCTIVNTREYRAPEVILESSPWSFPSDLWSLGCVLAELYTGEVLFQAKHNYEHLALIERAVGPFPIEMLNSPYARKMFEPNGRVDRQRLLSKTSQTRVLHMLPLSYIAINEDVDDTELIHLLEQLLLIDPLQRATASEALKLSFLKNCPLNF